MTAWLKEWGAVLILGAAILAWIIIVFAVGAAWDAEAVKDWLDRPLRDATVGDAALVVLAYLLLRK